jgi:hypothetical protein
LGVPDSDTITAATAPVVVRDSAHDNTKVAQVSYLSADEAFYRKYQFFWQEVFLATTGLRAAPSCPVSSPGAGFESWVIIDD